jgi:transposase
MHQAIILKDQGYTQKEIGQALGVSDRMVRNYLHPEAKAEPTVKQGLLEPYKDYITAILQDKPQYNLVVLKKRLQGMGYQGSMTILRVFAKRVRDAMVKQAVIRFETEPGIQAQVDWKEAGVWEIDGQRKKVYAFVLLLGYSRRSYVQFTTDMKSPTLLACHLAAFEYFGGVSKEILYDNMKTAWLNNGEQWVVNPALLAFAAECGFAPKRCKVRRPQTKGKVERFIGYLGNNFLPHARTKHIETLADLNASVNAWLDEINDEPIRTFCESRNERFEREQSLLQPYNAATAPDIRSSVEVCISREGTVRFESNVYSLPVKYLGSTIILKYHPVTRTASFISGATVIRTIKLLPAGSRGRMIDDGDKKELYALWQIQNRKKPESLPPPSDLSVVVDIRSPSYYDELCAEVAG